MSDSRTPGTSGHEARIVTILAHAMGQVGAKAQINPMFMDNDDVTTIASTLIYDFVQYAQSKDTFLSCEEFSVIAHYIFIALQSINELRECIDDTS